MKKLLLLLLVLPALASAQVPLCRIYHTVTFTDGVATDSMRILVTRCDKSGALFANTTRSYTPNAGGYVFFYVPRTTGTDSSYVTVRANMGTLATGAILAIPNADSAALQSLTTATTYSTQVVAVPSLYARAQGDSLRLNFPTLNFSDAFQVYRDAQGRVSVRRDPDSVAAAAGITAAALTDSLDANPRIPDVSARIRDSLNTIPRAETDPTATAKAQVVVKDSLNANARGYIALRDSLRADRGFVTQSQLRDVDIKAGDGVAALPLAVASTYRDRLDTLVENSGNIDISSPASTQSRTIVMTGFGHVQLGERSKHEVGATYKVVNRSGGISIIDYYGTGEDPDGWSGYDTIPDGSWQTVINSGTRWAVVRSDVRLAQLRDSLNTIPRTEVDPTATAKAQTVFRDSADAKFPRTGIATLTNIRDSISALTTGGVRGISSTARIFVSDDSITFVGEAGDVINAATGNVFRGTIGANDTLSVTGMVDGQIISIVVTNAGTYTLAWSGVNWAGGTAPTLSAVANKRDVFTLIQAGGIVYGSAVQDLR